MNSAGEISFTILSMTLSLAAVFHSARLHAGFARANFPGIRHHHYRRHSRLRFGVTHAHAADVLAHSQGARRRAPQDTGRSVSSRVSSTRFAMPTVAPLHWFLDHGWIAAPVLIACVIGVWFFFKQLPFTLLPTGDSGDHSRFLHRPGRCVTRAAATAPRPSSIRFCQANPAVDKYFTVAGRSGLGAGVFTVLFLKDSEERADIETVAAQLRKACSSIPGVLPTLNPQPVLQINIGAAGQSVRSLFLCHQWH